MNHTDSAGEPKVQNQSTEAPEAAQAADPAQSAAGQQSDVTPETIEKLMRERDEYLDMARRIQAEFDNFRKRNRDMRKEALCEGAGDVIVSMLPVLDNLERAEAAARDTGGAESVADGIAMVTRQMREALHALGVRPIEAEGKPFDPVLHNAVMQSPSDDAHPAGTVIEVFEKGYMHNDKVLRHSMVSVARES